MNLYNDGGCPRCGGRGWVDADPGEGLGSVWPCECRIEARRGVYRLRAGVPAKHQKARLGDKLPKDADPGLSWAWGRAKDAMRELLRGANPLGLVLWGQPGAGKSYLADAALLSFLDHVKPPRPALAISQPVMLAQVRDTYVDGYEGTAKRELLAGWGAVDLLVVHDLGRGELTPHTSEILWGVFDARYSAGLPTWATTNCKPDQLAGAIGDAAASRLWGLTEAVEVVGRDRRRKR